MKVTLLCVRAVCCCWQRISGDGQLNKRVTFRLLCRFTKCTNTQQRRSSSCCLSITASLLCACDWAAAAAALALGASCQPATTEPALMDLAYSQASPILSFCLSRRWMLTGASEGEAIVLLVLLLVLGHGFWCDGNLEPPKMHSQWQRVAAAAAAPLTASCV